MWVRKAVQYGAPKPDLAQVDQGDRRDRARPGEGQGQDHADRRGVRPL